MAPRFELVMMKETKVGRFSELKTHVISEETLAVANINEDGYFLDYCKRRTEENYLLFLYL